MAVLENRKPRMGTGRRVPPNFFTRDGNVADQIHRNKHRIRGCVSVPGIVGSGTRTIGDELEALAGQRGGVQRNHVRCLIGRGLGKVVRKAGDRPVFGSDGAGEEQLVVGHDETAPAFAISVAAVGVENDGLGASEVGKRELV